MANNFFSEQDEALKWKVEILQCGKDEIERGENISYKRVIAMIYEISCNIVSAIDTAKRFAPRMAEDGFNKEQLTLIQTAIAVRCVGHYPVSSVEQLQIKFSEQAIRELRAHYEYQNSRAIAPPKTDREQQMIIGEQDRKLVLPSGGNHDVAQTQKKSVE